MKRYGIVAVICLVSCQPEYIGPTVPEQIHGKWKLVSFTDVTHTTYTNADPCWADDWFDFDDDSATLSQGPCIVFQSKPQTLRFPWKFFPPDIADMGGDTVKIITLNDTLLHFKRDDPQFLEYIWQR